MTKDQNQKPQTSDKEEKNKSSIPIEDISMYRNVKEELDENNPFYTAPKPPKEEASTAPETPYQSAADSYEQNSDEATPAQSSEGDYFQDSEEVDPEKEKLRAELKESKEQTLRALAEMENVRRRARKEREDASQYSISSFARDLIEVSDNLRRALDAVPEDLKQADPRIESLIDGIIATERAMQRSFENNGIKRLHPVDMVFDPNFHEVMFEAPGTGKKPGTIIEVVEVGYMLNDRLLRPARVGVAKADPEAVKPQQTDDQSPAAPSTTPGSQIDKEA